MAILPLAPDQTIAQMWSNGVRNFRRTVVTMLYSTYRHLVCVDVDVTRRYNVIQCYLLITLSLIHKR